MEFDRDAIVQSFAVESHEGLAAMECDLLQLEGHPEQDGTVARIFRIVHTLKGNALLLGFESLSAFTHEVEDVLQRLRAKELGVSTEVTTVLLASVDALRAAVAKCVKGESDDLQELAELRSSLAAFSGKREMQRENEPPRTVLQEEDTQARKVGSRTLRVGVEKLDKILDLTGEISIARGRLRQMLTERSASDISAVLDAHADVDRLFLELQGTIMRARMVPVGPVFRQCSRAVRDIAAKLGKQAELVVTGEDVEVDTSVTELIRDPLVHMIRNALDHGIESPDERRAAGKHPRGRLELSAEHQGGSIVFELRDDGRGIDLDVVREKARVERLIAEDERPTAQDLYRLLFRGGFTTSREISDLSGRGVGLEVVRRNIDALRGSVQIGSERGLGTSIRIQLPLTIAIMEGFLVGVGEETYVIPLENAVECLDFPSDHVTGENGSAVIDFRGHALSVLRLRNVFDVTGEASRREKVMVVRHQENIAGLIVDEFFGHRQVVIKSLGRLAPLAYGISGSTILGDGCVALLLDVPRLMNDAVELTNIEA